MANRSDFIKFDPEKIMEASLNLDRQHKRFLECTANIKRKADSLRGVWQGDSAVLYADKLNELDRISAEITKRFVSFTQDLSSASGIYRKGETDAKRQAEGLPTEGVFLV
jgi:WXG100 family type VII secretion target